MTTEDFIARNNGNFLELEDISAPYQCVDLILLYADCLGIPRVAVRHAFAYQIFTQPNDDTRKYFQLIANTLTNFPSKGDIVVWKPEYNGGAGHCGVATGVADANMFNALVQNDPLKSNVHVHSYGYNGATGNPVVEGWLHPLVLDIAQQDNANLLPIENSTDDSQVTKRQIDYFIAFLNKLRGK